MSASQNALKTMDTLNELDDQRIKQIRPLIPPQILMEDFPLSQNALKTVSDARRDAQNIIQGLDDRLVVIVG
jgi:3-deoxy-7-phosphoheptulonate synthase